MSTLEERALADSDDSDRSEFAGTQRDTLTSFINTSGELVKMTAERDAALARNERQRATLSRIRTIVADPDAALVVDRVRAALEGTTP